MPKGTCGHCKKRMCGNKHCPCGRVFYCNAECQTKHWYAEHNKNCLHRNVNDKGFTMTIHITCADMQNFVELPCADGYKKKAVMLPDGSEIELRIPVNCRAVDQQSRTLVATHTAVYGDTVAVSSFTCRDSEGHHSLIVTTCRGCDKWVVYNLHQEAVRA
jgi:hypothetical protein